MPGQYYAFVPFTASELEKTLPGEASVRTIARMWLKDAKEMMVASRKQPIIIQYQDKENALLSSPFDPFKDTIYIIGHCHQGGNSIGSSRGGFRFDRAELDGYELVRRLLHYIPIATVNFKLLACFGGAADQTVSSGQTTIKSDSFASKFFVELKKVYRGAVLTAYLLPVKAGLDADGHKMVTLEDGSGNGGRPSANRVRFGI
jgi:hypothetical protein